MASRPREHDIVLFGATGFVGALTAQHLATHAPTDTRIALAGRNLTKLETARAELPATAHDWPLITADATDPDALREMAQSSSAVITTVGPYAQHGLPLVAACAEAGTDYLDLTGEVLFHREVLERFDRRAEETGARIVPSCGYDSVPSDLGVAVLAEAVARAGDGELGETATYATLRGGLSGGTIASMMGQAEAMRGSKDLRRTVLDPHALSPDRSAEPDGEHRDFGSVTFADDIDAWTGPFLMAPYNTRIVRRSNALSGFRYGRSFRYREVMRTGRGWRGRATGYAVVAALGGALAAMSVGPLRPLVRRVVPSPGQGPSERRRAAGFFRMDVCTTTSTGARWRGVVAADGDPGYAATSVMLGEAGLALALQRGECPVPQGRAGGVFTPATALGQPYADRLAAQGFSIGASRVS